MESTTSRLVMPGTEYNYLFPKPLNRDDTIKSSADVSDTVAFIQETIPKTLSDTRRLVEEVLWNDDLKTFCSKAWHFVYHHIPYKRDKDGVEQVRRPARAWADRLKGGVDCDCYTVFLGSCLFNAGIKFHLRICKYPKVPPETPYWQHIYIVVPKNQNTGYSMNRRDDYIVLDCVKDRFNSEEPYIEFKDFPMRLDYLNGLDSNKDYRVPSSVDAQDLASTNDIDELGELGEWLQTEGLDGKKPKKTKAERKEKRKQFFKKGLKFFNKVLNPATIALRNSVLLAMKVNFLKVASKIRFGYLSDDQASKMGLDMGKFAQLKKIREKVEKIYDKAGGKVENLRKAILNGKGNKDKKVPLSGLFGLSGLYGDPDDDENQILRATTVSGLEEVYGFDGFGELGVAPVAAALAAAATALAPIAKALSSVKGMFAKKGGTEAAEFDSEGDTNAPAPAVTDQMLQETNAETTQENNIQAPEPTSNLVTTSTLPQTTAITSATTTETNVPDAVTEAGETSTTDPPTSKEGFLDKAINLAKKNPLVTTVVAAGLTFGIYKFLTKKTEVVHGFGGINGKKRKKRKAKKGKVNSKKSKPSHSKITAIKLR